MSNDVISYIGNKCKYCHLGMTCSDTIGRTDFSKRFGAERLTKTTLGWEHVYQLNEDEDWGLDPVRRTFFREKDNFLVERMHLFYCNFPIIKRLQYY